MIDRHVDKSIKLKIYRIYLNWNKIFLFIHIYAKSKSLKSIQKIIACFISTSTFTIIFLRIPTVLTQVGPCLVQNHLQTFLRYLCHEKIKLKLQHNLKTCFIYPRYTYLDFFQGRQIAIGVLVLMSKTVFYMSPIVFEKIFSFQDVEELCTFDIFTK